MRTSAALAIFVSVASMITAGCELIAEVDRSKIPNDQADSSPAGSDGGVDASDANSDAAGNGGSSGHDAAAGSGGTAQGGQGGSAAGTGGAGGSAAGTGGTGGAGGSAAGAGGAGGSAAGAGGIGGVGGAGGLGGAGGVGGVGGSGGTPTAGLASVLTSSNFFTTTAIGKAANTLTLTNTGNTQENAFVFTLPANFSLATSSATPPCTVSGTSVTDTLDASAACKVDIVYTNNTATSQESDHLTVAYNYNGGTPATPVVTGVNYQVTQSAGNLATVPSSSVGLTFTTIPNNGSNSTVSTVLVTNTGDADATSFGTSITGTNNGLFSLVTDSTSPCSATIPAGGSCTLDVQFGPASVSPVTVSGPPYLHLAYTASQGNAASFDIPLAATLRASLVADMEVTGVAPSGFVDNFDWSLNNSGNPYEIQVNGTGALAVTYTNSSTTGATGFTTSYAALPAGYTLQTQGCSNATLAPNAACTDTYQVQPAGVGTANLDLDVVTASWTDESGPHSNVQLSDSPVMYVSSFAAPLIAIVPPTPVTIVKGSSFGFTAGLYGGYSVADQTITLTPATGSGITITSTPSDPCVINSSNTACVFTAHTDSGTLSGQFDIAVTNSGAVTLSPTSLSLTVLSTFTGKRIFVTDGVWDGNLGGLSGADALCNADSAMPNDGSAYKALLAGNNATTAGTIYGRLDETTIIAIATGGNLVGANPLQASIETAARVAWTGAFQANNCNSWSADDNPYMGGTGESNFATHDYWDPGAASCNATVHLYCVEQ